MEGPIADEAPQSWFLRTYPALKVPAYRLIWGGMLPAQCAQMMNQVAVGYAAYVLTGSATVLGLVTFASGIPNLVLSPIGGVVADRFPRQRVLMASQLVLLLSAAALALVVVLGILEVWHLVVAGAIQMGAFSFNQPARQGLIGEVVPRPVLRSATALNMTGMSLARIVGPSVAGMLLAIEGIGLQVVFITMACMYAVVLLSLTQLGRFHRAGGSMSPPSRPKESPWAQMVEGFRYILSSSVLRTLILMSLVLVFFVMPVQGIMPVFAETVFQAGPAGLGILGGAIGVGALIGSLVAAGLANSRRPVLIQLGMGVIMGVSLIAFAYSPSFLLAVPLLLIQGLAQTCYMSLNQSQIMSSAEPRLHGRVMSVMMMTFSLMFVVSLPVAWATDLFGAQPTTAVCGALVLLAMLAVVKLNPNVRGTEDDD